MAIKVYEGNETEFLSNGLGTIEPLECIETKKTSWNGWYIDVRLDASYKDIILNNRIILAETKEKGPQPFRIINPEIEDGILSFQAHHIVFDSANYMLDDVRPENQNGQSFLSWINDRTDTQSPYHVYSNISDLKTKYFIRKSLYEAFCEAELLFSAVFDFDFYDIKMLKSVGNDNNVTLRYGKNIQSAKTYEDWSNVVTKLLPVGPNGLTLPEIYVESDIHYTIPYTKTIEFEIDTETASGNKKDENVLINELRKLAVKYVDENKLPKINYHIVSDIDQTLCIGDTVYIAHPYATISTNVQSYQFDCTSRRVKNIEFGNYTRDVKKIFDDLKDTITDSYVHANNLIQKQTDIINRMNKEGTLFIDDNQLLICDKAPYTDSKKIWRFNLGGVGFSKNGYQGPYEIAITMDGSINANFIKTGILQSLELIGNAIKGGSIDINGNFTVNKEGNAVINKGIFKDEIDTKKSIRVGENIYLGTQNKYGKRIYITNTDYLEFYESSTGYPGFRFNFKDASVSFDKALGLYLEYNNKSCCLKAEGPSILPDLIINNTFTCKGTKSRAVDTKNYGIRKLNAIESASCFFEDFGNGVIEDNGETFIYFDKIWLETVNTDYQYYIFISPTSNGHVYCSNKQKYYFIVSGTAGTSFDWRIAAKQKNFENTRLEEMSVDK